MTDQHAMQATTYAYQNGIRWVVLTNGQEWRLYDSHITRGGIAERLAMQASNDDPASLESLFGALRRDNVLDGKLEVAVRQARLRNYLQAQLADPDSEVVRAVLNVVRKQHGLEKVSRDEVASALRPRGAQGPRDEPEAPPRAPAPKPDAAEINTYTIPEATEVCTHKKPEVVIFPQRSPVPVKSWKAVYLHCIEWLDTVGARPVPVPWHTGSRRSRRYWTNITPHMVDGTPMRQPIQTTLRNRSVYLETHASAWLLLNLLIRLASEVGADITQVRITIRDL